MHIQGKYVWNIDSNINNVQKTHKIAFLNLWTKCEPTVGKNKSFRIFLRKLKHFKNGEKIWTEIMTVYVCAIVSVFVECGFLVDARG